MVVLIPGSFTQIPSLVGKTATIYPTVCGSILPSYGVRRSPRLFFAQTRGSKEKSKNLLDPFSRHNPGLPDGYLTVSERSESTRSKTSDFNS